MKKLIVYTVIFSLVVFMSGDAVYAVSDFVTEHGQESDASQSLEGSSFGMLPSLEDPDSDNGDQEMDWIGWAIIGAMGVLWVAFDSAMRNMPRACPPCGSSCSCGCNRGSSI